MTILSEVWPKWVSPDVLKGAAKRVGIAENGLNVNWMQQDKFSKAEGIMESPNKPVQEEATEVASPCGVRRYSTEYYRLKYKVAEQMLKEKQVPDAADVPGLLSVSKVKAKFKGIQNVRVTQMYGSTTAKDALKVAEEVKAEKEEAEKRKAISLERKSMQKEAFYRCKMKCTCENPGGKCAALDLKECSVCKRILRSRCNQASCKSQDGSKPTMVRVAAAKKKTPVRKNIAFEFNSSSSEDETEDTDDTDQEMHICKGKVLDKDLNEEVVIKSDEGIVQGDYVQVITGIFRGYHAVALGESMVMS